MKRVILLFAVALGAETPATEIVNLSALDLSRLSELDSQESAARNWLRAIAAEREQIRLQICLRADLKASECGPVTPDSSGRRLVLQKLLPQPDPKDESKPKDEPKEPKP